MNAMTALGDSAERLHERNGAGFSGARGETVINTARR